MGLTAVSYKILTKIQEGEIVMKKVQFLVAAVVLTAYIGTVNVNAAVCQTKGSIENDAAGTVLEETKDFASDWEPKCGLPESSSAKIEEDEDGKYIDMSGIYSFISYDEITAPSEFVIALRAEELSTNIGVCYRTGSVFNLYEWDFHTEKGGQDGYSSIGATGIVLSPIEGGIRISIKTQDDDSTWGISSVYHDFTIEGIDYSKFVPIRFVDDGKKIEIHVNGALLATVEMENEGDYESDYDTEIFEYLDYTYYKTVSVKDAQATDVIKTEKARLVADLFFAGAAVRTAAADFKNVALHFTAADGKDEPTVSPESPTKEAEKSTSTATAKAVKTPSGTTASPAADKRSGEGGVNIGAVIGICAGVIVAGAVVIILIARKKGK